MTKMLQVRNVPEDLHEELRRRAAAAGLSLSDLVLRELRRMVSRPPLAEVLDRARRRGGRLSFAATVDALHEERETRR